MLRIKLARTGKKKQHSLRLIVTDRKRDPWGKVTEYLGWRDPHSKKTELKSDRIAYWLAKGAQPTDVVHNLLVEQKIIDGEKLTVTTISNKRRGKKQKAAETTVS